MIAAWRHRDAREGFEVAFLDADGHGHRLEGHTSAVEEGQAWVVRYAIVVDARWRTRRARIAGRSAAGARERTLESDGDGRWRVDGAPAPHPTAASTSTSRPRHAPTPCPCTASGSRSARRPRRRPPTSARST